MKPKNFSMQGWFNHSMGIFIYVIYDEVWNHHMFTLTTINFHNNNQALVIVKNFKIILFLIACWCEIDCLVIDHAQNYKKYSLPLIKKQFKHFLWILSSLKPTTCGSFRNVIMKKDDFQCLRNTREKMKKHNLYFVNMPIKRMTKSREYIF